ncbi:unnamed protein product, partial [Symbiodinium sp. CCMP2456]
GAEAFGRGAAPEPPRALSPAAKMAYGSGSRPNGSPHSPDACERARLSGFAPPDPSRSAAGVMRDGQARGVELHGQPARRAGAGQAVGFEAHERDTAIWPGSHAVARSFIGSLPPALQRQRKDGSAKAAQVPEYMYVDGEYQAVSPTGEPITEEQLQEEREASANAALELKRRVAAGTLEAMTGACGDVVAMDCRVFHRGSANCSSAVRVLLNASFQEDPPKSRDWIPSRGWPWEGSAAA